jgi:hypothetical protein
MYWWPNPKGKHQRAGHPGNWRKLPIGVTRPSGYRLPEDPEDTSLEAEFVAGAMKKRGAQPPGQGAKSVRKDIDLSDFDLGALTPEEARAMLARWNQKKD